MGRFRLRLIALEMPTLLLLLAVAAIGLAAGLILLWLEVGGNVAGWITVPVVLIAAETVVEVLGIDEAFRAMPSKGRAAVIVAALALAGVGSVTYVLWPGTTSWYLATLPAVPIILIVFWFNRDENQDAFDSADLSDSGPWTAP